MKVSIYPSGELEAVGRKWYLSGPNHSIRLGAWGSRRVPRGDVIYPPRLWDSGEDDSLPPVVHCEHILALPVSCLPQGLILSSKRGL